jgi:hypothetical protein
MLFNKLPDEIFKPLSPFFIGGDIDEGGLKIFIYIQGLLTRALKPHLMTPDLLSLRGLPNQNLRIEEVRRIADKNSEVMLITEAMLSTNTPKTLEQENIDPSGVSVV